MRGRRRPPAALAASLLLAATAATGCGAAGDDADTAAETAGAGRAADAETVRLTATIADGAVDPPPDRIDVPLGADVRLTVTSDTADELHVHGYDVLAELRPGEPAVLRFTADDPGLFEVETHHQELVVVQLAVR